MLIARLAVERGLRPILAGRNPEKIAPLAAEFGWEYRAFSLDDRAAVEKALADVPVVLHCAGPFSRTSQQMVNGCLRTKTHYLDINGEVENNSGQKLVFRLQCPEGYTLTAMTALAIVEKVLVGKIAIGFQTPSKVYGADFILEVEGVK